MAVATVWTRNCQKEKSEKCARLRIQVNLTITENFSLSLFRTSLLVQVNFEDSGVVVVIADPTILCLATLESANLAIDCPKMKNSTTLGFLSMLKMKMTRNTWSSLNSTTLSVVELLDPMCHFKLFALLLEYEVLLCLEPVEG